MDTNITVQHGRLTRDPEVTFTTSQKQVCKFSIAVNGMKKEDPNDTSFFNVVAWNKTAEMCGQYLKKGSAVIVQGRLKQSRFTDKNGQNRSSVDIVANTVQFVGGKKDGQPQQSQPSNDIPIPEPEWASGQGGAVAEGDAITGKDVPF
jgi:single-strand DNA-binding protein